MTMTDLPPSLIPWAELSPERQLALRDAYGRDPDCQVATCSLEDKIAQFADWLAARGVAFGAEDLRRRG